MLTTYSSSQAQRQQNITAAIRAEIQNRARAGLIDFAQFIDPNAKHWYRAKHLRLIANVLERVERGELKRVILSVPPRHWKSSLASEKFPAWYLGRHPTHSIIVGSYGGNLAERFSSTVRDTITNNPRFRQLFDIELRKDRQSASDWLLTTGVRSSFRAVGFGGGVTGMGAHLIIIDDPISGYEEAQSESQREKIWERYKQDFHSRRERDAGIVIIQTRWHEDDLAGRLIAAEKAEGGEHFEVINIPCRAVENDILGRAPGEFLWVDRFGEEYYYEEIAAQGGEGSYGWNALYQGNPVQPAGNQIKRDWFEYVPKFPVDAEYFVRAVDFAFTEKQTIKHDPDYTATCKACMYNDVLYLADPLLWRKSIEDNVSEVMALKFNDPATRLGMGRVAVKSAIIGALANVGISIEEYEENTDKIARASAWINLASQGRVKLVGTEKEWEPFMSQWVAFPNGSHDDAVDVVSGISQMLGLYFDYTPTPKKQAHTGLTLNNTLNKAWGM